MSGKVRGREPGRAVNVHVVDAAGDSVMDGTNNAINVTIVSGIEAGLADAASDSGTVVSVGGQIRTSDHTAAGNATRGHLILDSLRKLIVLPYSIPELLLSGTASSTGTGDTEVIATQGAGVRIYVTAIIISNSSATATEVVIKSAATARLTYPAPATSGAVHSLVTPLRLAANEALNFASVTGVTTMKVSAVGYKAAN